MKNRYSFFLNILSIFITAMICILLIHIIVYLQNANMDTIQVSRNMINITLLLAIFVLALFLAKTGIEQGVKRKAYMDVTGIMNKHACIEQMNRIDCNDSTLQVGFVVFDLNHLKKVNDFYGHEEGDRLILHFANILKQASGPRCFLGRFGGDEFISIINHCTESDVENYIEQVKKLTAQSNKNRKIRLSFASGYAVSTKEHYYLADELLKEADKKMYQNKKLMKADNLFETDQLSKVLDTQRVGNSQRDELTGVFEYDIFAEAVKKVFQIQNEGTKLALVSSDIYNFRYFNDFYGYQKGNNILRLFAEDLSNQEFCLCVHRIYSDNFAFLADVSNLSEGETVQMIRRWNAAFSERVNQTYRGSRLIVKSGICFVDHMGQSVEELINHANFAHKRIKQTRCDIKVYTAKLGEEEKKRFEIIYSFRKAMKDKEFKVYVQPQISRHDKTIHSLEALVRWERNDGTMIYPDEFIPVLEQTGDIVEMDYYVYEVVFSYLSDCIKKGRDVVPFSLNVSRMHLEVSEKFIDMLSRLQVQYHVPTDLIMFELTESAYIQEVFAANQFIEKLHVLGYKVSMDDYGSGYSSLIALQSIPFDEIKFDRAFLQENYSGHQYDVLMQMLKMVKSIGVSVVCEGVETKEHEQLLEKTECDLLQGYYYYRPFPIEDMIYHTKTA